MDPTRSNDEARVPFTIVVGLSFTATGGYAFDAAARLARRVAGSRLQVLHVVADVRRLHEAQLDEQLQLYVHVKMAALGAGDGRLVSIHLRAGHAARELARFATEAGADLIVVGAQERRHLGRLFVGSVAARLVRRASCPVVVAGPPHPLVDAGEPAIEPACADCLAVRQQSADHVWWCARHEHRASSAHVYAYQREHPFRTHDSAVLPTGIDMP